MGRKDRDNITLVKLLDPDFKIKKITIPSLQREYVQGRKEAKKIRNSFIKTVFEEVICNSNKVHFEFIYGLVKEEGELIPIDGQQRLTFLFLLHWFFACVEDKEKEFRGIFVNSGESRLTYETRETAKQFFDKLVTDGFALCSAIKTSKDKPSELIKNQIWFNEKWGCDSTIEGILVVLDKILEKWKKQN